MNSSKIIIKRFTGIYGDTAVLAWHGGRLFSVTANNAVTFIKNYKDATAAYLEAVHSINDPFQSANAWTEFNSLPEIFGRDPNSILINKNSRRWDFPKSWDDTWEF